MSNSLIIKNILKENNKITIKYKCFDKWKEFLCEDSFYSSYNINIESVPNSIAIIPFMANILPISWFFDLKIECKELDKIFYESISEIKKGYEEMYPSIKFYGNLEVNRIVENEKSNKGEATLFSGGVDAYCTLLRHISTKPDIITIFGADIKLNDTNGISNVNKLNKEIAEELEINYQEIYSNFREILNYHNLNKGIQKYLNGEWWHEFQHGIALIGLVAPLSYINGYNKVYIASSFCKTQKGQYCSASDPIIDNKFKYNNTLTVHDGYELDRQDKIKLICNIRKKINISKIKLRVCWESTGGKNCCHCEKCYRTIMGIITEKEDPNDYYFDFEDNTRKLMIKYLRRNLKYNTKNGNKVNYQPIQDHFIKNYTPEETPRDLKWFRKIKIGSKSPVYYNFRKKIKNKIKKIMQKL